MTQPAFFLYWPNSSSSSPMFSFQLRRARSYMIMFDGFSINMRSCNGTLRRVHTKNGMTALIFRSSVVRLA